jgi:hypothetical protein
MTAQGYTGPAVNLADVNGLQAALDAKLDEANGVVADSTLTVKKADDSAALRFRTTGGAVDVEKSSGDIHVSTWNGATPFTGVQTDLQRWRGDGTTMVGRTEFGTGPFAAEMVIDPTNGFAKIGGKNGMTPLQFCGRKATAGAPTTGTWAQWDMIIDSANAIHVCSVAGTPGTWT